MDMPYIINDDACPIWSYLQKNSKTYNLNDVDKIKYDYNMNLGNVVIENAFRSL